MENEIRVEGMHAGKHDSDVYDTVWMSCWPQSSVTRPKGCPFRRVNSASALETSFRMSFIGHAELSMPSPNGLTMLRSASVVMHV
jgi:hypothetical protein